MRKLMPVAAGLLTVAAVLAAAGLALAKSSGSSITSVTGTFAAATVAQSEQQSCTTSDGKTIQTTNATYTGTASGDASLAGDVSVHARSVIDTTDDLGTVDASVQLASGEARFTGVYDHGKVAGLLTGRVGSKDARAALLANVSAGFSSAGGFTAGKVGSSDGGSAIEASGSKCAGSDGDGKGKGKGDGKAKSKSDSSSHGKQ